MYHLRGDSLSYENDMHICAYLCVFFLSLLSMLYVLENHKDTHLYVITSRFAVRSVTYWQTHLKLLLFNKLQSLSGKCCMLIVIIP